MEIKLNKFGCFIFALGLVCLIRETCQDVKKLNKEMKNLHGRVKDVEEIIEDISLNKEDI